MKIKQKRQVNLHELVKWAWENDIEGVFKSVSNKVSVKLGNCIVDTSLGDIYPTSNTRFEIEEEVEINEDRKLKAMLYINDYSDVYIKKNWSINDRLQSIEHRDSGTQFIYFMNEDGSIGELIWKDGEMVE